MPDLTTLNARFAIPGIASIAAAHGELPAVHVHKPGVCSGTVFLHGAHVTAWKPEGQEEVLWFSQKSAWQNDKPIRGGVPLCFPWFGPRNNPQYPNSPMHGFARIKPWSLESIAESPAGITVLLTLQSDPATLELWPVPFTLRHRITFGRELAMSLEFSHSAPGPVPFEEAQHTYFSIGDVHQIKISGLDRARYIDKTDNLKEKDQQGDVTLSGETDRVYLNTATSLLLTDPVKRRRISIHKENSQNTVVWNPWNAKAKSMPDFGDEEWPHMLCIESANAGPNSVTLPPNQFHGMRTQIAASPL